MTGMTGMPQGWPPHGQPAPPLAAPPRRGWRPYLPMLIPLAISVTFSVLLLRSVGVFTPGPRYALPAQPCRLLDAGSAARLVPHATPRTITYSEDEPPAECLWFSPTREADAALPSLRVMVTAERDGSGTDSPAEQAAADFDENRRDVAALPVRNLADEAYVTTDATGTSTVVFRRSNLTVTVEYEENGNPRDVPVARSRQATVEIARQLAHNL